MYLYIYELQSIIQESIAMGGGVRNFLSSKV